MKLVAFNEEAKLSIYMDKTCIEHSAKRAGNAHSLIISDSIPKSIDKLAQATAGSGHDCFLKGIVVYIDWSINKIIREQLLRYNFINVISSCSLMHCFEKYKKEGLIPPLIETVDDLPMGFAYPVSFQTNYLQLKTIYKQRRTHKREEWQTFCRELEGLPNSLWITGKGLK
jgi:hypothetical protein